MRQTELENQAQRHAATTAREVALALEQKLALVGNSIVLASLKQAGIYLFQSDSYGNPTSSFSSLGSAQLPLRNFSSFAEYKFSSGCTTSQTCPSDYGPLCSRSPITDCNIEGSMSLSSVYMYMSNNACAIKSDADWNLQVRICHNLVTTQIIHVDAYSGFPLNVARSLKFRISIRSSTTWLPLTWILPLRSLCTT